MPASHSASRRTLVPSLLFLLSAYLSQQTLLVSAQDPFNCHVSFDNGTNFDLTSLSGEHVVARTRETPPSVMTDEARFDLCSDLPRRDGVAEEDQVRFPILALGTAF